MTADLARHPELERLLSKVLYRGSWLASCVIALGLILTPIGPFGARVISVGIALFILLPVLRVLLMLIVFVRERDYCFSAIATLVLVIIVLGAVLDTHAARGSEISLDGTACYSADG
jgi:uncharacterized membrane protein